MIFVNFKDHFKGQVDKAIQLAQTCQEVAAETGVQIIPVVQKPLAQKVAVTNQQTVWLEKIDEQDINAELLKTAGGSLLNHSDYPLSFTAIERIITATKTTNNNFKFLLITANLDLLRQFESLQPDYLAYEPPQLIGNPEKSVASEEANIIEEAVSLSGNTPLIVGAGIHSEADVRLSLEKGARGILVSSFVLQSENPKEALLTLTRGFS